MKVKEASLTACVAWSPASVSIPYLVCGTAAQHADPSAKNDCVQVFSLNLSEENLALRPCGSVATQTRFHDIVWGEATVTGGKGVIACAGDDASIYLYKGSELISGGSSPLLTSMEGKHAGPVYCLDFNHHQPNLLASGSRDCEVFIWDISDPTSPMSPGTKAALTTDVTSLAWNRQVEHILTSVYGGRCVVFDLRKSSSIVQISDAVSRMKAHSVRWHPNVATQLALSSADDITPTCQLWDLRFASAPVRQFDGHQRGIESIAWCDHDPDILVTTAKDNRTICWSANHGGALGELPSYNQWSFSVRFCPRDNALLAAASVDGTVSVYSLLGGGYPPPRDVKFSAIADSFPGMEMPTEVPVTAQPQSVYLRAPPAFMKSRGGCSFGFAGRMASWESGSRVVNIHQVVTEPDLLRRSQELMLALQGGHELTRYCDMKHNAAKLKDDKEVWQFIAAGASCDCAQYLSLLGHVPPSPDEVLAANLGGLSTNDGSTGSPDPSDQFELIAAASQGEDKTPEPELDEWTAEGRPVVVSETGEGGIIRRAIVDGRFAEAVQLCLQQHKNALALVLAQHDSPELYAKTRDRVLVSEEDSSELCGLVSAVVRGDLPYLVTNCELRDWRHAAAAVLTHAPRTGVQETPLLQLLGARLQAGGDRQSALLCYLLAGALDNFAECWAAVRSSPTRGFTNQNLQDLVEMILIVQRTGRITNPAAESPAAGSVARCVDQFATLLATQGALTSALHYLNDNAEAYSDSKLLALRDRVSNALGYGAATRSIGIRSRTLSTASSTGDSVYRRASTPSSSFQSSLDLRVNSLVPAQFTPSLQASQAAAFAGQRLSTQPPAAMPNYFQPQPVSVQPAPSFGGFPPTATLAHIGPPPTGPSLIGQPPLAPAPVGPSSTAPPTASVSVPGGLRRQPNARYVSTPSSPQPGMMQPQPSMMQPQPVMMQPQPNSMSAFQHFQPIPPTNMSSSSSALPPSYLVPSAPTAPPLASGSSEGFQTGEIAGKTPAAFDPSLPRGWNDPPPPPPSGTRKIGPQTLLPGCPEHSGALRLLKVKLQQQSTAASTAGTGPSMMTPAAQSLPAPQPSGFQPTQPQAFQGFQGMNLPPGGFGVQNFGSLPPKAPPSTAW